MAINILDYINLRNVGNLLRQAREDCRRTQEEAARIVGVEVAVIAAIEEGEYRLKAGELIKLSRLYGKPVSDFVRPNVDPVKAQNIITAVELLQQGVITEGQFANAIGVDRLEARWIVGKLLQESMLDEWKVLSDEQLKSMLTEQDYLDWQRLSPVLFSEIYLYPNN